MSKKIICMYGEQPAITNKDSRQPKIRKLKAEKKAEKVEETFMTKKFSSKTYAEFIQKIEPKSISQEMLFTHYHNGNNLLLHGYAGTGKTFLSMALALKEILSSDKAYERLNIIRSVVPSRDMGFLPGDIKEKSAVFEAPYADICNHDLFGKPNSYENLKNEGVINFTTTSFLRGMTFSDSIIFIDEFQNMVDQELHTLLTRVGPRCRVIVSGDIRQSDLERDSEKRGMFNLIKIIQKMPSFRTVEFSIDDVVRSKFCKEYLIAKDQFDEEKKSS